MSGVPQAPDAEQNGVQAIQGNDGIRRAAFDRSKYEFELDQVSGRGGGGHSIERYQIFG